MTSWQSLPFEIKARILAHYIDITLASIASREFTGMFPGRPAYPRYQDQQLQRFIKDVRSFLYNAREMRPEAARMVDEEIKRRLLLYQEV